MIVVSNFAVIDFDPSTLRGQALRQTLRSSVAQLALVEVDNVVLTSIVDSTRRSGVSIEFKITAGAATLDLLRSQMTDTSSGGFAAIFVQVASEHGVTIPLPITIMADESAPSEEDESSSPSDLLWVWVLAAIIILLGIVGVVVGTIVYRQHGIGGETVPEVELTTTKNEISLADGGACDKQTAVLERQTSKVAWMSEPGITKLDSAESSLQAIKTQAYKSNAQSDWWSSSPIHAMAPTPMDLGSDDEEEATYRGQPISFEVAAEASWFSGKLVMDDISTSGDRERPQPPILPHIPTHLESSKLPPISKASHQNTQELESAQHHHQQVVDRGEESLQSAAKGLGRVQPIPAMDLDPDEEEGTYCGQPISFDVAAESSRFNGKFVMDDVNTSGDREEPDPDTNDTQLSPAMLPHTPMQLCSSKLPPISNSSHQIIQELENAHHHQQVVTHEAREKQRCVVQGRLMSRSKEEFNRYDKNGDGVLDRDEMALQSAAKKNKKKVVSDSDVHERDADGDGLVDQAEFIAGLVPIPVHEFGKQIQLRTSGHDLTPQQEVTCKLF